MEKARSAGGDPIGRVRSSCTAALGIRHVSRGLFSLQDRYPGIAIDDLLKDGTVERVLPDLVLEPVPLSILFVPARARIAGVRLVIDTLAAFLGEIPGIQSGTRQGRQLLHAPE